MQKMGKNNMNYKVNIFNSNKINIQLLKIVSLAINLWQKTMKFICWLNIKMVAWISGAFKWTHHSSPMSWFQINRRIFPQQCPSSIASMGRGFANQRMNQRQLKFWEMKDFLTLPAFQFQIKNKRNHRKQCFFAFNFNQINSN